MSLFHGAVSCYVGIAWSGERGIWEHWWIIWTGETRSVSHCRVLHHKAHIGVGLMPGVRGEKLVTSRLCHCAADHAAERLRGDKAHCHDAGCYGFFRDCSSPDPLSSTLPSS